MCEASARTALSLGPIGRLPNRFRGATRATHRPEKPAG